MSTHGHEIEGLEVSRGMVRENQNQVYFYGDLVVAPKLTEQMLAYAYLEFERQGLNKYIWYEGVPPLSWYLEQFKKMVVLGCFREEAGEAKLKGLGWINALTMMGNFKKAEVGMAFFREVTTTYQFGNMMIDWGFSHLGLDAMHGATPVKNPAAIRYMRNLGFEHCGPVEGYCSFNGELCGCEISWMTRTRWEHIRPIQIQVEKG